jgi:hypothetical protein
MALKIYNAINASRRRLGKKTISFSPKGIITISKLAVEEIKLKPKQKVSIAQDEKNVKDWYLFLDNDGLELRETNNGCLIFNSSLICEDIRACVKDINEDKSIAMLLVCEATTIEKVKCFPIIVSSGNK